MLEPVNTFSMKSPISFVKEQTQILQNSKVRKKRYAVVEPLACFASAELFDVRDYCKGERNLCQIILHLAY